MNTHYFFAERQALLDRIRQQKQLVDAYKGKQQTKRQQQSLAYVQQQITEDKKALRLLHQRYLPVLGNQLQIAGQKLTESNDNYIKKTAEVLSDLSKVTSPQDAEPALSRLSSARANNQNKRQHWQKLANSLIKVIPGAKLIKPMAYPSPPNPMP
jgi:hypothetical protein